MEGKTMLRLLLERWAANRGMSDKQMAYRLGMTKSKYSLVSNGRRGLSMEDAHRIAEMLGLSLDAIYMLSHE